MTFLYDLKTGYPSMELVPRDRLSELTAQVLGSGRGWQYGGDLRGILAIREQIARFLTETSPASVTPDHLMMTAGAIAATDLVCRAVTKPGDVVVVEDPTFYYMVGILRMSHVEVVGVPLRAEGIDLDALKSLIDRYGERLKLVYAIPSFQNPTGITATNRAALAEMARRHNFHVLEDSTYQLLYYGDNPPPPYLKTYDDSGRVITVGTMSKLLMPSLRLGWVWAQPEQIQAFKEFKDDAGSALVAEVVGDYMRSGEFAEQVERARRLYARKHDRIAASLDRYAPDWLEWSAPGGGFFIWATMPEPLTATKLLPFAQQREVSFFNGRDCYANAPHDRGLRLCFAKIEDDDDLEEAVARLCDALNAAMQAV
ncbi:MAG: PLP-dependent aminotransferase family protein [Anaerolineae bacterium]|nr:PLP-dependent aminotransferase family protein [Anaerolineae bacterium]